eukprot:GHRR01016576.1.p2 GENE.GHRR01016576.1~~GHRR01016576.1.p2  ORF type:complete len:108 (+),score=15.33 GHRR01016576.1:889-1212(+)
MALVAVTRLHCMSANTAVFGITLEPYASHGIEGTLCLGLLAQLQARHNTWSPPTSGTPKQKIRQALLRLLQQARLTSIACCDECTDGVLLLLDSCCFLHGLQYCSVA